jgi:predicted GNAT family N-acyltransferase
MSTLTPDDLLVGVVPGPPPQEVSELRHRVFVEGQGVDPAMEHDHHDAAAVHAVARLADGAVIGTGRLIDPGGVLAVGRIGRMAVEESARGLGVGRSVLVALEAAARDRGLVGIELHAQEHAEGFYRGAGYVADGERYEEQNIPHVTMRRSWLPDIRPARTSDSAGLQALMASCFAEYPGCVLDVVRPDGSPGEEGWTVDPASGPRRIWVVPGPDGSLLASVGAKDREVKAVYVSPSARRQGWGSVLVRMAERTGAGELWSDTRFLDAHRLYERLGWHRTGEERALNDPSNSSEWRFLRSRP